MTRESNLIKRKPRRAIWKAHIKVRLAPAVYGATAILPKDWMARVHRVQNNNTNGRVGHCLDVLDLFLAKAAVGRDKDRDFCLENATRNDSKLGQSITGCGSQHSRRVTC